MSHIQELLGRIGYLRGAAVQEARRPRCQGVHIGAPGGAGTQVGTKGAGGAHGALAEGALELHHLDRTLCADMKQKEES